MEKMTRTPKILLIIFSSAFIIYCAGTLLGQKNIELPEISDSSSFVVLELFTSQGCSSCPAADEQIRNIKRMAQEKNLPVYTMSFHVDYWDQLGWKDCYSDKKFTARQYQYSRAFSKRNIYTPQMVVNGTNEFVGSDGSECQSSIANALQKKQMKSIEFKGSYSVSNDKLQVSYGVEESFNGYINIALVQNEGEVKIKSGENSGRKITYTNIVRSFKQIDCRKGKQGLLQIEKPKDLADDNLTVIIYLQNKIDMKILGITKAILI